MLLRSSKRAANSLKACRYIKLPSIPLKMSSFASSSAKAGPSSRPIAALVTSLRLPDLRGMKELDRGAFDVPIEIMSIRVPSAKIHGMMKHPSLRR